MTEPLEYRWRFPWRYFESSNARLGFNAKTGRVYGNPKYKLAKAKLRAAAIEKLGHPCRPDRQPWELIVMAHPPTRKWDHHNLSKIVPDALETVLYRTDNQVERLILERIGVGTPAFVRIIARHHGRRV